MVETYVKKLPKQSSNLILSTVSLQGTAKDTTDSSLNRRESATNNFGWDLQNAGDSVQLLLAEGTANNTASNALNGRESLTDNGSGDLKHTRDGIKLLLPEHASRTDNTTSNTLNSAQSTSDDFGWDLEDAADRIELFLAELDGKVQCRESAVGCCQDISEGLDDGSEAIAGQGVGSEGVGYEKKRKESS
jgi:hypothetical protein